MHGGFRNTGAICLLFKAGKVPITTQRKLRIESSVITGDGELLGKFPAHAMPMNGYDSSAT
jgi:hypothetical protein